jgi:hypothetical protein
MVDDAAGRSVSDRALPKLVRWNNTRLRSGHVHSNRGRPTVTCAAAAAAAAVDSVSSPARLCVRSSEDIRI